jgi:hypothetical protein
MNQRGKNMKKAKNLLLLVAILISGCAQISSSENSGSSGSSIGSYTDSSSSGSSIGSYTDSSSPDSYIDIGIHQKSSIGTYPQSKVTDATLLSTLNAASGTLPTSTNSQAWTDYGYYINGSVSSYMWYIDITNASDEYRGVYFTSYRPDNTNNPSSTIYSEQDDNGYTPSFVYWFKYEPITWRVLDVQSNRAFLMADLVLDSQDYHYSRDERTIGGSTVYANNYEHSHIRSWLNDNFYNTAFTAEEKARIQTTTVDNSVASTGYSSNKNIASYVCANTSDKVFLLSYAEVTSATYGFTYGLSKTIARQLKPSAYAQSQGVYTQYRQFSLAPAVAVQQLRRPRAERGQRWLCRQLQQCLLHAQRCRPRFVDFTLGKS